MEQPNTHKEVLEKGPQKIIKKDPLPVSIAPEKPQETTDPGSNKTPEKTAKPDMEKMEIDQDLLITNASWVSQNYPIVFSL